MNKFKVAVIGRNKATIQPVLVKKGFDVVTKDPQFVISYGGDGTLMQAEFNYPGIPKIILKDSTICKKCSLLPNDKVLELVRKNKYALEEMMKLEVSSGRKTFYALNDVIVHNNDPRHAIRYSLSINGKLTSPEIIGDGVVVATPFGSTAYYRSITDSFFELGIGLAFNNSTEQADHMVLKEDSVIEVEIMRGQAVVYADNQDDKILLDEGNRVTIKKSHLKAIIVNPNHRKN